MDLQFNEDKILGPIELKAEATNYLVEGIPIPVDLRFKLQDAGIDPTALEEGWGIYSSVIDKLFEE